MSKQGWTRQDVLNWLQECSCEEEETQQPEIFPYDSRVLIKHVNEMNGIDYAICPETYQKAANFACANPKEAVEAIRPVMEMMGIACPQSFARALADVFTIGQDLGMIVPINPEIK